MASKTWEDQQMFFTIPDKAPGFRLHRLEVLNWGTFHRKVWTLEVNGETSLLTGDIGSGKSSLVDAITTLLVAPQRITYNKAAGAETKERTLRSYVMGYYKSERSDFGSAARPVALRDETSYSVILGTFHNEALGMVVTLAQVFWVRDKNEQPERFYVVANRDLTVAQDFSHFGTHLPDLKRRLASQPGCTVKESFKEYETLFRRTLGIKNRQALDLFSQAISMKSVGNLTQFVRDHMLEPFDVETRIARLVQHFDDLNRSHEAVLKAKKQLEMLEPLVADGLEFARIQEQIEEWNAMVEALPGYMARHRVDLLTARLEVLHEEATVLGQKAQAAEANVRKVQEDIDELKRAIKENGGERLSQIAGEIAHKEEEKIRRKTLWDRYCRYLDELGLPPPQDDEEFGQIRHSLRAIRDHLEERVKQLTEERDQLSGDLRDKHNALKPKVEELTSLKKRRTNIPGRQIEIRRQLAQGLGAGEEEFPYVGELIQVHEDEAMWEGAIERLLHHFGLSMLVPETYYGAVAAWVEQNHLHGRLVYHRVPRGKVEKHAALLPQSVVHKLRIQPHTPFYAWLEHQLAVRFDYACTQSLDEFRRQPLAITPGGQIKSKDRHEKDDRYDIQDRTRYVLGWDNRPKIEALERECQLVEQQIVGIKQQMEALARENKHLGTRKTSIDRVDGITDYRDLDWGRVAAEIGVLQEERMRLERTSDVLQTLQQQLEERLQELDEVNQRMNQIVKAQGGNETRITDAHMALEQAQAMAGNRIPENIWDGLQSVQRTYVDAVIDVAALLDLERRMREHFTTRVREANRQRETLQHRMTKAMAQYRESFSVDTHEVDDKVEAWPEYQKVMEQLKADDLPRFEEKFKTLLNENTIRDIVQFQAQLAKERELIRERVEQINQSLAEVEYNPGRYIRLNADPNPDREVREFHQQLRAATEGTLTGSDSDQYSEAKFLQVKAIVDRFRGREGSAESDRLWTAKVTDVRNEFTFSASERWTADNKEHEHYTDSGGKSGGQKEKLAYSILAASLAYQLGSHGDNPRSFRFVVIDEAFGRGSDESAQFGLELFRHLNLQLLIVTPLQKIHVIEPYVASVGFVHNAYGKDSQIRNVSIEEYRAEREERGR
ncbi:MAG: hypothetical protein OWR62_08615 [Sulfobacillus thermotolerans]|nr:hypothetical protein [Sulfobacillus thermotolerans]